MELVNFNAMDIPGYIGKRCYSNNIKLLMKFYESDIACCEVKNYPHKNAKSCHTSLMASVKKCHLYSIRVIQRGDRIFLVKD